jgi:TonB family protein
MNTQILENDCFTADKAERTQPSGRKLPWISISAICHLMLVLPFVVYFHLALPPHKLGDADHQVISSYLVTSTPLAPQATKSTQEQAAQTLKHAIALTHRTQASQTTSEQKQRATVKGAPMPELVALLHAAIQREQHYPESAQQMEREGRATLSFTLYPNGNIARLKLLHSSGTNALDHAALDAVSKAAPFADVGRYMNSAQTYAIDVVFQLS